MIGLIKQWLDNHDLGGWYWLYYRKALLVYEISHHPDIDGKAVLYVFDRYVVLDRNQERANIADPRFFDIIRREIYLVLGRCACMQCDNDGHGNSWTMKEKEMVK